MDIETEEKYCEIIFRLLVLYPLFEKALYDSDVSDEVRLFLAEELDDCYTTFVELRNDTEHVSLLKKNFSTKKTLFSEKLLTFLYLPVIKFHKTNKMKGIPISKNFIKNLKGIMNNKIHLHHSHITGEIIGYAHNFCNGKVKENKYKVTVIAHNLFRFDFFFH